MRSFCTGEETCFPTFPHRNLFSLFLNFRICCQPNAAPGFGLLGSSLRQSGALEKLLASQIAKRLDASRAASAQPKISREEGRGLKEQRFLLKKACLSGLPFYLTILRMRISRFFQYS